MTMTTTSSPPRSSEWNDNRPDDWTPLWVPPPTFGTPRRPERDTYGGAAAIVADKKLGQPFMPWQSHVADVSQEVLPSGFLAYSEVIVTIPRQSGKTTGLLFAVMVMRCLLWRVFGRRQRIIYTAQDRNHAREKFEEDFIERLTEAPGLTEGVHYDKPRLANGSERIRFKPSRSTITISATSNSAGHGNTLDMPSIDEAWEHKTTDVDAGFRVPMITRREIAPGPQLWVVSTEGDETSLYLDRKVKQGREAVEAGLDHRTCFFQWSAPSDSNVWDRRLWWFTMPALGHTIGEDGIAAEAADMDEADFKRAYYNIRQNRGAKSSPIDAECWGRQVDAESGIDGRLVLGAEVSIERDQTSIGVAGERSKKGGVHVEVLRTGEGTTWAVDWLAERVETHEAEGVAIAPSSPAGSLIGPLEARGVKVFKMSPQRQAHAAGEFHDKAVEGGRDGLWHLGQDELDDALENAQKRNTGDEAWVWDRRSPDVDITPLVSCTLALGALMSLEPDEVDEESIYDEHDGFPEMTDADSDAEEDDEDVF